MATVTNIIRKRPVRFYLLLNSILALIIGFGVAISTVQQGLILAAVNAALAFFIEGYTTPVDGNGTPLNPDYTVHRGA